MGAFKKAVATNFRDPIAAWLSMDKDFSGNVDSTEFGGFCHKFRLPDRTVNCLFNSVNSQNSGSVSREMLFDDFVWLMEATWERNDETEAAMKANTLLEEQNRRK